jgi:hypothetical protein
LLQKSKAGFITFGMEHPHHCANVHDLVESAIVHVRTVKGTRGADMVGLEVESLAPLLRGHDTFVQHHRAGHNAVLDLRSMSE